MGFWTRGFSASKGSSSSIRSFCAGLVSVLTTLISLDSGNYASSRVFIDESGERYGMGKLRSTAELRFEGCGADGIPVVNLFGIPFYREVFFFSSNLGAWVNSARRNLRCPDLILYPGQGLF